MSRLTNKYFHDGRDRIVILFIPVTTVMVVVMMMMMMVVVVMVVPLGLLRGLDRVEDCPLVQDLGPHLVTGLVGLTGQDATQAIGSQDY